MNVKVPSTGLFVKGKNCLIGKEFKFIKELSSSTERVYAQGIDKKGNLINKITFHHAHDGGIEIIGNNFLKLKGSLTQILKNIRTNYFAYWSKDNLVLGEYSIKFNRDYNVFYPLKKFIFEFKKNHKI